MHQKISYEIFSKRGKLHEKQGKENEDAINIITNGDYMFVILSDGAGSGPLPKMSSQCTVDEVGKACSNYSNELFCTNEQLEMMVFKLQSALEKIAYKNGYKLKDMMATLIIFGINIKSKEYITIHVGDGLVAEKNNKNWEILSYPENKISSKYTFFPNSSEVFDHLRVKRGIIEKNSAFFISTDGFYENCTTTKQFLNQIQNKNINSILDDVSYCKVVINDL